MRQLANQIYLNADELPFPEGSATHDANDDGRFDVSDYAGDSRVTDRNNSEMLDPEDLILTFSDGIDDDSNGYLDDISGWDFFDHDNNALDDVDFGHGTDEIRQAVGQANNGGDHGTCPSCMGLPVRVGDSFIVGGTAFAMGVLFALDSGASVVQEALGLIDNPRQVQMALDAAYRRNVPMVTAMSDEASKHPNMPVNLERTIPVTALKAGVAPFQPEDYLGLSGCTNYGGHAFIATPTGACSSGATAYTGGMVGLLQSAAKNRGLELSANEITQIIRASADDVDFATPDPGGPGGANNILVNGLVDLVRHTVRYRTTPGWDESTGYGRINASRIVRMVDAAQIPPEAEIISPRWFAPLGTRGTVKVTGRVAAPREPGPFKWRLEYTTGHTPPPYPGVDSWTRVSGGTSSSEVNGTLGRLDLAAVAARLPGGGSGVPEADGVPDPERFSIRLRLVVTSASGLRGEHQKQLFVHADPDLVAGYPKRMPSGGTSSPSFADLNRDGRSELIVPTDDGLIHAYQPGGRELAGWPVRVGAARGWPSWSETARADRIPAPRAHFLAGAPAVADLDGDGSVELAAGDTEGRLHVWGADGRRRAGFPVSVDARFSSNEARDEQNRVKPSFGGAPAIADLDADGRLDIIASGLDRHVYAWHDDGSPVSGFPVLVVDPAKVEQVDPTTHKITFRSDAHPDLGGEIPATPSIGDLDGDGRVEIVVGVQEQYKELANYWPPAGLANSRVFAIHADGNDHARTGPDPYPAQPSDQAYLPGWPSKVAQLIGAAIPSIGGGVAAQAAIGDVNGDGRLDVVVSTAIGPVYVLDSKGRSIFGETFGFANIANMGGLLGWNRDTLDEPLFAAFGGPSIGQIDPGGTPEFAAPTAGLGFGLDILLPHEQRPSDSHLMVWNGIGWGVNAFPHRTSDMAFFVTPAIADTDGDGRNEVVAGNGLYTVDAVEVDGADAAGFPKLTGGWVVGTPGFGDWDGDGRVEMAIQRRDGWLFVYRTRGAACSLTEWPRSGHDSRNTGNASTPTGAPACR